jgi:hypothetical protein
MKLNTYPGGGVGSASLEGGHPLWLQPIEEGMEQTIGNEGLQILHSYGGEGHGSRGRMTVTLSAIAERRWWRRKG